MENSTKKTRSYHLPIEVIAWFDVEAKRQRRSASVVVGMVLEEWMEKQKEKDGAKC